MYASLVGTSQALHLMLAGESGNSLTGKFYMTNRNLMKDLKFQPVSHLAKKSHAKKQGLEILSHLYY